MKTKEQPVEASPFRAITYKPRGFGGKALSEVMNGTVVGARFDRDGRSDEVNLDESGFDTLTKFEGLLLDQTGEFFTSLRPLYWNWLPTAPFHRVLAKADGDRQRMQKIFENYGSLDSILYEVRHLDALDNPPPTTEYFYGEPVQLWETACAEFKALIDIWGWLATSTGDGLAKAASCFHIDLNDLYRRWESNPDTPVKLRAGGSWTIASHPNGFSFRPSHRPTRDFNVSDQVQLRTYMQNCLKIYVSEKLTRNFSIDINPVGKQKYGFLARGLKAAAYLELMKEMWKGNVFGRICENPPCSYPVFGRSDKKYCSVKCRVAGNRYKQTH